MKNLILRGLTFFFILLVATAILIDVMGMQFGTVNYWDKRGIFFLFFITIFPRLTLLFSSVATGGFVWWLGFVFAPRILVASLATVAYFHTNPVLVVISWMIAVGGEVFEKWGLGSGRVHFRTFKASPRYTYSEPQSHSQSQVGTKSDVIEAEFTKDS